VACGFRAFCAIPRSCVRTSITILFALLVFSALSFACEPASAQSVGNLLHFPPRPPLPKPPAQPSDAPMLVQAAEIRYDYTNNTVAAVGNVQIYYNGATVEADQVIYDQKNKRLQARGNVRMTEADGKITYGQFIDLTDDYRDGFVDSLRLETADDTRFAAARADRVQTYNVMQNGVYTACEPCKDDPKKPPLWQIEAARIIHDTGEKMVYFEDARVEFFGLPLAYFPFMSAPDPSVVRKSGFLFPNISYGTAYGVGAEIPYYWSFSPSYDLATSALFASKGAEMLQGTWRQRLMDGAYTIKAAGVFQQDTSYFTNRDGIGSPTANQFRGAVQTSGQFAISDKWVWGWTGLLLTDRYFLADYNLAWVGQLDPFHGVVTEGVSQVYLTGAGDRSYFDIRTIYYTSLAATELQAQNPIIHPVLDYSNVLGQSVLGGEFSYKFNLTSLTRQQAEFDAINQNAANNNLCTSNNPAVMNAANCLLRGIAGTYSRTSAEADWRRTFVTDGGQMLTPFFGVRGDVAALQVQDQVGTSNFITPGQTEVARAMPDAGVEYRYPFINVQPWGTQTIQPIAQLILRPNEAQIGKFPNEDAQSLVFSDANLFSINKFSGWDRVEGGGRVNAGIEYTAQFNRAGAVDVLFGQSYQIYGVNSYAATDLTNTGLQSGLDKTLSDYVGRVTYSPNQIYSFIARGRFDEATFTPKLLEFEGRANFDRWTFQLLYGDYAAQPAIGFLNQREQILVGASFKVTQNWVLLGSVRYDLVVHEFDQTRFGIAYTDDCLLLSLNLLTGYLYNGATPTPVNTVMFQMSLRTLGPNALAPVSTVY
jgi:LPS-assembly protein